jgi:hypothetical protein
LKLGPFFAVLCESFAIFAVRVSSSGSRKRNRKERKEFAKARKEISSMKPEPLNGILK